MRESQGVREGRDDRMGERMTSQLFTPDRQGEGMKTAPMGVRLESTGRYKMPLLPDESGPKSGGDWVPGGLQSMTNLAGSISDTRALGIWEIQQVLIGMGMSGDLREEIKAIVQSFAGVATEPLNWAKPRTIPGLPETLGDIAERAKNISGANAARDAGIERHDVWEVRGKSQLFSTNPAQEKINAEIRVLEGLLDAAGMEVVPELCERTVRNLAVQAAGRFDNVLLHRASGRLLMADLKTKREKFWGWLEIDAQLAGYAYAELMLAEDDPYVYEPGPLEHVDLTEGVVLHMPSDGSEPRLRRADLVNGWEDMQLARRVCTKRSYGRSVKRERESYWPVG